jgi:stage II sporulation protein AB (anti-sigma F factor)
MNNKIKLEFEALSENEGLARVVIAAFISKLDVTLDELEDVKTAVSEAVTNAIIHGYSQKGGTVVMEASLSGRNRLDVTVSDSGIGIADVKMAMEPLFTTGGGGERSGMGFAFMEAFMDGLEVESEPMKGTRVYMWKNFDDKLSDMI